MALSAAEKQKRYRERRDADPAKRACYLLKSKQKYKADKAIGKNNRKPVSHMTEREHRHAKKLWKKEKQRYRKEQKKQKTIEENLVTPPMSPITPNPPSRQYQQSVKKLKKDKAKCYRDNAILRNELQKMEKKSEMYRKRWQRSTKNVTGNIPDTPRTKTRKLLRCLSNKTLQKTLDFHHVLIAELREKYKKGKKSIAAIVSGNIMKKYRCLEHARNEIGISTKHGNSFKISSKSKRLKQEVHTFFERDDVSQLTTGKKETITKHKVKKQRRILLDTISNQYQKFVSENGKKIGFSTFCKLRPFWVTFPREKDRKTCLCKTCENMQYLSDALYKIGCLESRDMEIITRQAACSTTNKKCMYAECDICKDMDITNGQMKEKRYMTVSWTQWRNVKEERVFKSGIKKDVVLTVKQTITGTVDELADSFLNMLCLYKKHAFNIRNQLHHYRELQQSMSSTECIIHVDFAENYNGKMAKEIQSMHYGASQAQISLHTGFYKVGGASKSSSFCGVSDSLNHGPASIWAYLKPVLKKIRKDHSDVKYIHFYSDGPTTQYRQKSNFYLFATEITDLGFEGSTWNFMEAGHGKGIPDGIGATVKRIADQRVLCGNDIINAQAFISEVQRNSQIQLYEVKEAQIEEIVNIIERQNLKPVPGTMRLHQVILDKSPGHILYRDISCLCLEKICDGHELKKFSFPIDTRKTKTLNTKRKIQSETENQHVDQEKRQKTKCSKNSTVQNQSRKEDVQYRKRITKYEKCLERFQKCTSFAELKYACQTVSLDDIHGTQRYVLEGFDVDTDAIDVYPTDVPGNEIRYPVKVVADGNCMVGCGSIFAFGNDTHVAEIRARVVIELALNEEYYLQEDNLKKGTDKSTWTSSIKTAFAMYSPEYVPGTILSEETIKIIYEHEVLKACKPKTYLGIWQLFGISSILQMPVFSVYPEKGNPLVRGDLHRLIQPRTKNCNDIAYIMWSSTRKDMVSSNWVPNHFVSVLAVDSSKLPSQPDVHKINEGIPDEPSKPEVQEDIPEQPSILEVQEDIPDQPSIPQIPYDIPEQQSIPQVPDDISEQPSILEVQEDIPEQPSIPHLPDDIPEQPSLPHSPDDIPEQPSIREVQEDIPEQPSIPEVQEDIPDQPSIPQIPYDIPEQQSIPQVPDDISEQPSISEVQEDIPEQPNISEVQEDIPEQPSIPHLPDDIPEQPSIPEVQEDIPEQPSIPQVPDDIPEQPRIPEVPDDIPEQPSILEVQEDISEQPSILEVQEDIPEQPSIPHLPDDIPEQPRIPEVPDNIPEQPGKPEVKAVPEQISKPEVQDNVPIRSIKPEVQNSVSERSSQQPHIPERLSKHDVLEMIPEQLGKSEVQEGILKQPDKIKVQERLSDEHSKSELPADIHEQPGECNEQEVQPDDFFPAVPPTKDCLGKYVVVVYDKVPYPGYVEDTDECDVYVSCMHKVGRDPAKNCFFWPKLIKDKCWYEHHNILAIIPEPQKIDGSCRHFEVAPALWKLFCNLLNLNK